MQITPNKLPTVLLEAGIALHAGGGEIDRHEEMCLGLVTTQGEGITPECYGDREPEFEEND